MMYLVAISILSIFPQCCSLFSSQGIPEPPCTFEFLERVLNLARPIYHSNTPFPYVYVDNFFPDDLIQHVAAEFPDYSDGSEPAATGWHKSAVNVQNRKMERLSNYDLPPATQFLISFMQSGLFVLFLSQLTGIDGLMPDPHLYGGGMHQLLSGGHLSVHLDYNFNDQIHMWRRVNVFLYLNENWDDQWGGHLEFWNANITSLEAKIAPIFNRLTIFTANEETWHGHPDPLRCPADVTRKSIALYYYTAVDGYKRPKRMTDFRPRASDQWTAEQGLQPFSHS